MGEGTGGRSSERGGAGGRTVVDPILIVRGSDVLFLGG